MSSIFKSLLVDPLISLLVFIHEHAAFGDLGIAIILLTLFIRALLAPLFYASFKAQAALRKLQPHVRRIQDTHKDNREAQGRALMELYREHGVNPFMSIVLIVVQLPVLIALYHVSLYPPAGLDPSFLGLINLHEHSSIIVGIAAIFQYIAGVLSASGMPAGDPSIRMAKNMAIIGPILTIVVLSSLPAAVGVYWITTTTFSIAQQIHINRKFGRHGTHTENIA